MKSLMKTIAVFIVAGLIGPLLRVSTYKVKFGEDIYSFLYSLILFLWPTQPFAVIEASVGTFAAFLIALGANLLFFAVIGVIVGFFTKWRSIMVWPCYGITCCLVLWYAWWGSGYSIYHIQWISLLVALSIYAIPFYVVTQIVTDHKAEMALA